jgi:hypothetical protein
MRLTISVRLAGIVFITTLLSLFVVGVQLVAMRAALVKERQNAVAPRSSRLCRLSKRLEMPRTGKS